jgi:hypothetical protein
MGAVGIIGGGLDFHGKDSRGCPARLYHWLPEEAEDIEAPVSAVASAREEILR